MNRESFIDEILRLQGGREALVKTAKKIPSTRLYERLGAIGGLGGAGAFGLAHLKAMITGNPYDAPIGTMTGAAARTGAGGLGAAGVLKLLGRLASKGKRRR